jgi:arylsulfatase A-like enzyme
LDGHGAKDDPVRILNEKLNQPNFSARLDYAQIGRGAPGKIFHESSFNQFKEFLDLVPEGKPFFLQFGFKEPHRPFDGKDIPDPVDPAKLILPSWIPDMPDIRKDMADYYDFINRLDGQIGRVMDELERRKLKDNTLIIFISDNGAAMPRGKGTLYELGIRVPLIVRWPGKVVPGSRSDVLVSGEDLGPTCLAVAGIATPTDWTGQSFLPVLLGEKDPPLREYIYAMRGPQGLELPGTGAAFDLSRVIVGKQYKLIYNAMFQLPYSIGLPGRARRAAEEAGAQGNVLPAMIPFYTSQPRSMFELYDLEKDPDELDNLIGKSGFADLERELRLALSEWMILERDFLPLPVPR